MKFDETYISKNRQFRDAWIKWLTESDFTHSLTFQPNRGWQSETIFARMKRVHRDVDEALLGSRYHLKPPEVRTRAVFIVEGLYGENAHVHSLWAVRGDRTASFEALFNNEIGSTNIFEDLCPGGSSDLQLIADWERTATYLSKGICRNDDPDRLFFSRQFFNSTQERN